MKRITLLFEMLMVVGCLSIQTGFAAVIRVPADYPKIQSGIDAARDGDTVFVADGTYSGDGNRDLDFRGNAITVASENGAERCVIDCMGSEKYPHRGFLFDSKETEQSILRGFSIINGFGEEYSGGSIVCLDSSPTIQDCIFTVNTATFGGAIYCYRSSPIVTNCVFSGNNANLGGAVSLLKASPIIYNCRFSQNGSPQGGAIAIRQGNPLIVNCLLTVNSAVEGGAIYCDPSSLLHVINCTFSNNEAHDGAALFSRGFSSATIQNCIFRDNYPNEYNHASDDCIRIEYCNIRGGHFGIGNIDKDSLFIGGDPFDFRLQPDSPCIDSGTSDGAPSLDYDGNPRPQGGAVDIGAHEFSGWPSAIRAYVQMPAHRFEPDDTVFCTVSLWNPSAETLTNCPLFVVLDVFGNYFCAPDFSKFDHYTIDAPSGLTKLTVIPEFRWPSGAGSASDIVWYAALTNPEMTELTSPISVFDFGWSD